MSIFSVLSREILLSDGYEELEELEQVLMEALSKKVAIRTRVRGDRAGYLRLAKTNATNAVNTKLAHRNTVEQRFLLLEEALEQSTPIKRMECFDISHTMGESTVASCVVFNREGPDKSEYRRYNIKALLPVMIMRR